MTPAFRLTLLWVAGTGIMVVLALMPLSAAFLNGEYIPSNADAFYHARRILDVVMTGQPVQQFDPKIHVPEGSWITWPWGFDWAMAHITRWFGPFASEAEANSILMRIPVAAAGLYVGAVVVLARQLRLPDILAAMLVFAAAALPVITYGFSIGNLDHHFAEGLWMAFTLCAGIWFFSKREALAPAVVLGLVLASAVAVHNSLFILQIPVVLVFLLRWLQGEPLPSRRGCIVFAGSLVLLTLAVCAPSEPWRRGFFEFYTLSWFHAYIAACTAAFCCAMGCLPRKPMAVWLVLAAAMLAAAPIVGVLGFARLFMSGELDSIQGIVEVNSPYRLHAMYGATLSSDAYSWLLWLSAPMVLFTAWLALKSRDSRMQFFAVASTLGLLMLQLQYRFHVFGVLSLVVTPLLAIHLMRQRWPAQANRILVAGCAAFLVLLSPVRHRWTLQWDPGGYPGYKETSGAFPVLRQACASTPGIVLTGLDAGHWVRYHSACSVIANAFLLTSQHAAKMREANALMSLSPERLLEAAQPIRYILVFHSVELVPGEDEPDLTRLGSLMLPLEARLLGPLQGLPAQFRPLWSHQTPAGQTFARLFEIVR